MARGSFAAWARDKSLEELQIAAKNVAELMECPGWALVQQLMGWRRAYLLDGLVHGPILEQSQYAAQTGMVSGIDQLRFVGEAVVAFAEEREAEVTTDEGG